MTVYKYDYVKNYDAVNSIDENAILSINNKLISLSTTLSSTSTSNTSIAVNETYFTSLTSNFDKDDITYDTNNIYVFIYRINFYLNWLKSLCKSAAEHIYDTITDIEDKNKIKLVSAPEEFYVGTRQLLLNDHGSTAQKTFDEVMLFIESSCLKTFENVNTGDTSICNFQRNDFTLSSDEIKAILNCQNTTNYQGDGVIAGVSLDIITAITSDSSYENSNNIISIDKIYIILDAFIQKLKRYKNLLYKINFRESDKTTSVIAFGKFDATDATKLSDIGKINISLSPYIEMTAQNQDVAIINNDNNNTKINKYTDIYKLRNKTDPNNIIYVTHQEYDNSNGFNKDNYNIVDIYKGISTLAIVYDVSSGANNLSNIRLTPDGSNGAFSSEITVTKNDTFNLTLSTIKKQFGLERNKTIDRKQLLNAVDYIFQFWLNTMSSITYLITICHRNCHNNTLIFLQSLNYWELFARGSVSLPFVNLYVKQNGKCSCTSKLTDTKTLNKSLFSGELIEQIKKYNTTHSDSPACIVLQSMTVNITDLASSNPLDSLYVSGYINDTNTATGRKVQANCLTSSGYIRTTQDVPISPALSIYAEDGNNTYYTFRYLANPKCPPFFDININISFKYNITIPNEKNSLKKYVNGAEESFSSLASAKSSAFSAKTPALKGISLTNNNNYNSRKAKIEFVYDNNHRVIKQYNVGAMLNLNKVNEKYLDLDIEDDNIITGWISSTSTPNISQIVVSNDMVLSASTTKYKNIPLYANNDYIGSVPLTYHESTKRYSFENLSSYTAENIKHTNAGLSFSGNWYKDLTNTIITKNSNLLSNELPNLLSAQFNIKEFKVTFDLNGGKFTSSNESKKEILVNYKDNITYPANNTFSNLGYTFIHWDPQYQVYMPAHDLTCFAIWNVSYNTVSFYKDNSSDEHIDIKYVSSTAFNTDNKNHVAFTRYGYKQNEWKWKNKANGSSVEDTFIISNNLSVYYDGWTKLTYKLTLNANDGNFTGNKSIIEYDIGYDDAINANILPTPTLANCQFDSWKPAIPIKMPAINFTCYAQWKCTITFYKKSGTAYVKHDTYETLRGTNIYLNNVVAKPTLDGYYFNSWTSTPNGNNIIDNYTIQTNLSVYAKYVLIILYCKIGFLVSNGYFDNPDKQFVFSRLTINNTIDPPTPTHEDDGKEYTYTWNCIDENGPNLNINETYTITNNDVDKEFTYIVVWEVKKYTVMFTVENGYFDGDSSTDSITLTLESNDVIEPPIPTHTADGKDYTYIWNCTSGNGPDLNSSETHIITNDLTYEVVWSEVASNTSS